MSPKYKSPLSIGDTLDFHAIISEYIQQHKLLDITVDIKALAGNEFVLVILPEMFYLWKFSDWEHFIKGRKKREVACKESQPT